MFPLEKCIDDQLRAVRGSTPTLIFPEADDPRVVCAASGLIQYAKIVLVARREDVERLVDEQDLKLRVARQRFFQSVVFAPPEEEPEMCEIFSAELTEKSRGRSWEVSRDEARRLVLEPVYFAILAVRLGYADAVLGGVTHSSRDFFQPCLRLLERSGTVYEMGLFALPDEHPQDLFRENLVMFADVALNPEPEPERLAEIAVGACVTMRNLIPVSMLAEVNGALLSYSTRGSGSGPSVDRVRRAEPFINAKLAALARENPLYETIHIAAELQIGCAISKEAARTKLGAEADANPAVGNANVLIVPSLDVGNLLYHIYSTRFPDARSVLIIGGLGNKALDFSRGSKVDDVIIGAKALMLRLYRSGGFVHTPNDAFFPRFEILTVNPTAEYTEIGLWHGMDLVVRERTVHTKDVVAADQATQLPARRAAVQSFLERNNVDLSKIQAFVARGGLLPPVPSGTYRIDDAMIDYLANGPGEKNPVNLGTILVSELAGPEHHGAFAVDPAVVDELDECSRLSGIAGIDRHPVWHALSQKAAAKMFATRHGREYEDLNLIVAHLGAGISVGAHRHGKCVEVNNALFEGPMALLRPGSISSRKVVELCFSGLTKEEVLRKLMRGGGAASYLGTIDFCEMERRAKGGDELARRVIRAMIERVAGQIASLVPKFFGEPVDQLILTGALTESRGFVDGVLQALRALSFGTTVYEGDIELEALRDGALRVLRGVEDAVDYSSQIL